jgi:hypothetical protein
MNIGVMELSTIVTIVFVLIIVSIPVVYSVLRDKRLTVTSSLSPNTGALDKPTAVGTSTDVRNNFINPSSATFTCYVYISSHTRGGSSISLFTMGTDFKINIIPAGASHEESCELVINTQRPPTSPTETIATKQPEIFKFQRIPTQKWVLFTITKEGRRFTVYYNDAVVASFRTLYYPSIEPNGIIIGNSNLKGTFAYPTIYGEGYAFKLDDVKSYLESTSNTRHEPELPNTQSIFDIFQNTFTCPNGIFCFNTTQTPQKSYLKKWSSPYS